LKTKITIPILSILLITFISVYITNSSIFFSKKANKKDTISISCTKTPVIENTTITTPPLKISVEDKYLEGYNLFFQKKYTEAIKIEKEVLSIDPQNFKAYNIIGIATCFLGDFDNGIMNINESIKLNSNYEYSKFNKALAFELFGQYNLAIEWYDKSLEIEKDPWSYYGKASIYGRRGDIKNTVLNLKLAIEIEPAAKECAKSEEDFDNVRKYQEFRDLLK
jgi:tetratricopeptide (TPR) repeat protein